MMLMVNSKQETVNGENNSVIASVSEAIQKVLGLPRRNFVSPRKDVKSANSFSHFTSLTHSCGAAPTGSHASPLLCGSLCNLSLGFTLAEVLITLGIIGVVAALTIPTLMANYQKNQYVTQLKEDYSLISQALKLMMADEGVNKVSDTDTLTASDSESQVDPPVLARDGEFLRKYFKVVKDCGADDVTECYSSTYKTLDGSVGNSVPFSGAYCVTVSNGSTICMRSGTQGAPGTIILDTNGLKKPNEDGRDMFSFSYYYDGTLDDGTAPECRRGVPSKYTGLCQGQSSAQDLRESRFENNSSYGAGCLGKIINDNWKMDY